MKFRFTLDDAASPTIDVDTPVLGQVRVHADGRPVERMESGDRPFLIPMHDGTTRSMVVRRAVFDYAPRVTVNGVRVPVARKLRWHECAAGGLPLLFVVKGGVVGVVVGLAGLYGNYWILRSGYPWEARLLGVVGVTFLCPVLYLRLVLLLTGG